MTDAPKVDDRDEFLEWMVDRKFKLEQPNSETVLFYVADYEQRQEGAPEGLGPEDLKNVSTKSTYIRCTILTSEEVEVAGEQMTANVERVQPPEDETDVEEVAFDTIRINWRDGNITEL